MKPKKIPLRTCIVTREKLPKQQLVRIVKDKDGNVKIDLTGKMNGRGCYIKKDIQVLSKLEKSTILNKHLEINIPQNLYNELRDIIDENS